MEEKFIAAWAAAREKALALGIRMRPVAPEDALKTARYLLDHNRCSDGFDALAAKGQLGLSLEALATDRRFTALFTDEQAIPPWGGCWTRGIICKIKQALKFK